MPKHGVRTQLDALRHRCYFADVADATVSPYEQVEFELSWTNSDAALSNAVIAHRNKWRTPRSIYQRFALQHLVPFRSPPLRRTAAALEEWLYWVCTWARYDADRHADTEYEKEQRLRQNLLLYRSAVQQIPATRWADFKSNGGSVTALRRAVHIGPHCFQNLPPDARSDDENAMWALALAPAANVRHVDAGLLRSPKFLLNAALKNLDVLAHVHRACMVAWKNPTCEGVDADAVADACADADVMRGLADKHKRHACTMMLGAERRLRDRYIATLAACPEVAAAMLLHAPDELYGALPPAQRIALAVQPLFDRTMDAGYRVAKPTMGQALLAGRPQRAAGADVAPAPSSSEDESSGSEDEGSGSDDLADTPLSSGPQ